MAPFPSMSLVLSVFTALIFSTTRAEPDFKPPINDTLEAGVETECKTCPYTLCTNKSFLPYNSAISLVCWTRGTSIGNDTTWLRTSDGCYVTQYDLTNFNGTWEDDLSYCGRDSEAVQITYDSAVTKYDTECNICDDDLDCAVIKYLPAGTELTVTCWTDDGQTIIDDSTWLKTIDNCYVAEKALSEKANKDILDNCGPVGFLQVNDTNDSDSNGASLFSGTPETERTQIPPGGESETNLSYLVNATIGEDIAFCYSCRSTNTALCSVVRTYKFNHEVDLQCYAQGTDGTAVDNLWDMTTDWCWLRDQDIFQSALDFYNFPDCSLFGHS